MGAVSSHLSTIIPILVLMECNKVYKQALLKYDQLDLQEWLSSGIVGPPQVGVGPVGLKTSRHSGQRLRSHADEWRPRGVRVRQLCRKVPGDLAESLYRNLSAGLYKRLSGVRYAVCSRPRALHLDDKRKYVRSESPNWPLKWKPFNQNTAKLHNPQKRRDASETYPECIGLFLEPRSLCEPHCTGHCLTLCF